MERTRRVARLWDWLPHFRAVAETPHLPTVSRALNTTASVLTESIRQLEEDIGRPLFDRAGKSLLLNASGKALLGAVRGAMRLVHEGVQGATGETFKGSVSLAVSGPFFTVLVWPILERLHEEHPRLVPTVQTCEPTALAGRLLRGELDIAVTELDLETDGLLVERFFELEHGIFVRPGHPLTKVTTPSESRVLAYPFVAPPRLDGGHRPDAFPPSKRRSVGLEAEQLHVSVEACRLGPYVGCFPVIVGEAAALVRVPFEALPTTSLFLARRPPVTATSRTDFVADVIKDLAAQLTARTDESS